MSTTGVIPLAQNFVAQRRESPALWIPSLSALRRSSIWHVARHQRSRCSGRWWHGRRFGLAFEQIRRFSEGTKLGTLVRLLHHTYTLSSFAFAC
eukprot:scaffold284413_cov35-Prasinocladus_malaysianus.AAC.1